MPTMKGYSYVVLFVCFSYVLFIVLTCILFFFRCAVKIQAIRQTRVIAGWFYFQLLPTFSCRPAVTLETGSIWWLSKSTSGMTCAHYHGLLPVSLQWLD